MAQSGASPVTVGYKSNRGTAGSVLVPQCAMRYEAAYALHLLGVAQCIAYTCVVHVH